MPSFENIHKNKKYAFIDGALCGLLAGYIYNKVYKPWREF